MDFIQIPLTETMATLNDGNHHVLQAEIWNLSQESINNDKCYIHANHRFC